MSELPTASRPPRCSSGPDRSVLNRVANVIDAFEAEVVMSLDDLTAKTGLPRSTVYRFVEQLRAIGWVERVPSGYLIGLRLFELGGLAPLSARLRSYAGVWLLQAHRQSRLTVHLGILDGDEIVYVDKISAPYARIPTRIGGRFPAHCTGLGRAIFSGAPQERFEEVLDSAARISSGPGKPAGPELRVVVERARKTGVATDMGGTVAGIACVASPIRVRDDVVGAVSVTGPVASFRSSFQRNAGIVKATADGIAGALTNCA